MQYKQQNIYTTECNSIYECAMANNKKIPPMFWSDGHL